MPPKKIADTQAAAPSRSRIAAATANSEASSPTKPAICSPSGSPSIESSGSDRAGIPSMEAGTLKTGFAGGAEPDRSDSRRGEDNRGIVARRKTSVGLPVALPDGDGGAILAQG